MSDPQSNPVEDFIEDLIGYDDEEEERAENQRLMERLRLNRPKLPPLDLDEILRTMPKRRTRRSTQPKPMETNDGNLDF